MAIKSVAAPIILILAIGLAAVPGLVLGWDYTWDDPILYDYSFGYDDYMYEDYGYGYDDYNGYGGYGYGRYDDNSYYYVMDDYYYSPYQYQNQFASAYQAYQPMYSQSQYQSQYSNYGYGYGQQQSYQAYGFSNGTPTGDTIPYVNEPLCNYPGYGRYSCLYHPGQPLYDYWTGTWY